MSKSNEFINVQITDPHKRQQAHDLGLMMIFVNDNIINFLNKDLALKDYLLNNNAERLINVYVMLELAIAADINANRSSTLWQKALENLKNTICYFNLTQAS